MERVGPPESDAAGGEPIPFASFLVYDGLFWRCRRHPGRPHDMSGLLYSRPLSMATSVAYECRQWMGSAQEGLAEGYDEVMLEERTKMEA